MATKKKQYYDISALWKTGAQYMIPLGQRGNGKSYQARQKVLERYRDNGERFVYLRRWKDDIKPNEVIHWFNKKQLKEIFPGVEGIQCLQNKIWTYDLDEKGQPRKLEHIGWYLALNEAERYKSWEELSESNVVNIVYEEFITDKIYIDDEPSKLLQLVSTAIRHKEARVFLIGNTISEVCPYFEEWELTHCLEQKQGTIDLYHFKTLLSNDVTIAVEQCPSINYDNKMFFGNVSKQILGGEWQSSEHPKRPKGKWTTEYEMSIKFGLNSFVLQLQSNEKDEIICFVYKSERVCDRVITNEFSPSWDTTKALIQDYKAEQLVSQCWRRNKFCYSTNLVGTTFNTLQDTHRFIF